MREQPTGNAVRPDAAARWRKAGWAARIVMYASGAFAAFMVARGAGRSGPGPGLATLAALAIMLCSGVAATVCSLAAQFARRR